MTGNNGEGPEDQSEVCPRARLRSILKRCNGAVAWMLAKGDDSSLVQLRVESKERSVWYMQISGEEDCEEPRV